MRKLRDLLGVSRRTVERWRRWWQTTFAESRFWRRASATLMPPVERKTLPASLLSRFAGGDEKARLAALLRFLGPITGGADGQVC